ncbi:hypothetical protein DFH05DRAFT_1531227 [Lentinula detonsa]|uniref:Chromo domain-containing protein n=1 Tax=Lentinula detonsa TaxID=2804962 RepID=A0A9W8NQ68_9AGAR|nr:hypothetical protein DFH05DRAFT_1531227 [Lentinula detonsa]
MKSQNISEAETQFIDLPDDDVNLWDALEIVGESATQFKIKWDGMNPATGKPWPDSWVQKHDATPDLVQGWRVNHPRKISTASTSRGQRAKTSSTRTRKGKRSRGDSETTASRHSTKSKSPVKYISRPLSNRGLGLNRYPSVNSVYVLIDSAKRKKSERFTNTKDEDVQKQAETKRPTLNPGPSTSQATSTNDNIVRMARPKPFAKKTAVTSMTTRTPKPEPEPRIAARNNPTSLDETDELDIKSPSRKYPHPQNTLPTARTLVDKSNSQLLAKVANQSSFVLNPDSPLAPRSQKKHNNAQSHGTSDLGKSGSLLKNSLNNVPVFMPSGSKIKTTHLPPASKSDVLQNSSVSAESNDIQPQPASPLPHITDAHVSQSSEPANSSGALGPNQQASESVPQLKTNLQSSPEPLRPPVMREIVLSPGAIGRLQEFDEFLASLPPDSPAPPSLPWVALQVEEDELDVKSPSRKYPHPQKTLPTARTLVDKSNSQLLAKVANQSSFVLNPDSPLAPRSQKKHNNAQSHGTSDLGKSGSLLKNSLNNVPVFMPSGSKIKTTHLPPASKSDVLQNSSVSAESNDIQPQPASPLPHITDAHVSQSSESANSSGALGPNQQASESVPQLKTNLQSSPEPLRPPVMREIVLSPGAIGRLQEFDEFLASLPPDSPAPPSLPRVALQVEEDVTMNLSTYL